MLHHVHRIPGMCTTHSQESTNESHLGIRRIVPRNETAFPGMCNNSQELRTTCMNPGNDFESVVEKVPFGDHIPRNVGIIPRNSTNPGNEFQNKLLNWLCFARVPRKVTHFH